MRPKSTIVDRLLRSLAPRALAAALLVTGLALTGAGGCAAPTLPLPPPSALVSTPDGDGVVTVTGVARSDALVFALNEERGAGVIGETGSDGAYTLRLAASIGETVTVWQMVGSDTSQLLSRVVPDR